MVDCYGNQVASEGLSDSSSESTVVTSAGSQSGSDSNKNNKMSKSLKFGDNARKTCIECYRRFLQSGCAEGAAKGILSNIYAESQFDYDIVTWDRSGISCGLIQFHWGGELNNLANYYNCLPSIRLINEIVQGNHKLASNIKFSEYISFELQLDFIIKVIFKRSKVTPILNITDPSNSARRWMEEVERPKDQTQDRWLEFGNTINKMLR